MKSLFALLSLLLVATACNTTKPAASADVIISVMHGTHFGHCRGYCRKDVIFSEKQVSYIESSVDTKSNPDKKENFDLSAGKWKNITDKIDWNKFQKLEERYGCPDCADGGSEYIEITTASGTKRVTIEFNKESPELEPLLKELRKQRKELLKAEGE
ncbi:hypothetical protein D3C87_199960 [compost metagenome]